MPAIQRLVASLVIAALPCSAVGAQTLSKEAMFTKLSALASTGNAEVQYNLGMFLNNGIGTGQDNRAAFKHFSDAAAAGHALAAYKVGCYLAGQFLGVVPVDEAGALKFKLRAAEAGYELAQQDVGIRYTKLGDFANAQLWLERASRQGNLPATAYLAQRLSGDVSADQVKAYALLLLLKERLPAPPQEMTERIAKLGAQLSDGDKAVAATLRTAWVTGETPLTLQAKTGLRSVGALIASLER